MAKPEGCVTIPSMSRGSSRLVIDERHYVREVIEKAPAAICPHCGAPAEMEEFWSSSPDDPTQQIHKRQIRCSTRAVRKKSRWNLQSNDKACPVVIELLGARKISAPEEFKESSGKAPRKNLSAEEKNVILTLDAEGKSPEEIAAATNCSTATILRLVPRTGPPPANPGIDLDQAIHFLAQLPEEALQEIGEIVALTRHQQALRRQLQSRLRTV